VARASLSGRAKVAEGPFETASFTVSMARKDVRLMVDAAAEHGCPLVVMPAVAAAYDAAIARGESAMDSSVAFRHVPDYSTLGSWTA
jgi:3-hydroxyisobutyrate dehydrogenase-like beta-hydroxyacid dehydrogenase